MAIGTLFVAPLEGVTTLEAVASTVFRALGLKETEERFSTNYPPDEHYFAGYAANIVVVVADADDDRMSRFPFAITLKRPTYRKGSAIIEAEPAVIASMLAAVGLRAFVPLGEWYRSDWDGQGVEYAA